MRWSKRTNKAETAVKKRPDEPDPATATEEDLLEYGNELIEYLESRYPLRRNAEGSEIVRRL